jgi:hypothetical protein
VGQRRARLGDAFATDTTGTIVEPPVGPVHSPTAAADGLRPAGTAAGGRGYRRFRRFNRFDQSELRSHALQYR